MRRNPVERSRVNKLFELAPIVGVELPPEIVRAAEREVTLQRALKDTQAERSALPSDAQLAAELWEHAGPTPTYRKRLAEQHAGQALLNKQERQITDAIERATWAVVSAVYSASDDIITAQLQPRLAEIVETVRAHTGPARRIPWSDMEAALFADDEAIRQAYSALRRAAEQYMALRGMQGICYLNGANDATREAVRLFSEIRGGLRSVWAGYGIHGAGPAPWEGMSNMQRLDLLINRAGADLWCPTLDEALAAYRELVEAAKPQTVIGAYVGP